MKYRILFLVFLSLATVACNERTSTGQTATSTDPATKGSAAPDPGTEAAAQAEEAGRPALKSEQDMTAIKEQWEATAKAEQAFLATPKFIETVENLKGSTDEDGFDQPGQFSEKDFSKLTVKEQLYYYLFHPEFASQNCDMAMFDAGLIQGISAYLPNGEERYQSDRQTKAMNANKSEVSKLAKECLKQNKALSVPMMRLIASMQLKELIVPMIDAYAAQTVKDDLLLTTAVEIMRTAQWPEWMSSNVAKEMQTEAGGEYGGLRDFAALTSENINELSTLAKKFASQ